MFAVLSALFLGVESRPILRQSEYQILEGMKDKLTWKVGINPMFQGMSEEEFRSRLMVNIEPLASNVEHTVIVGDDNLPKQYIFNNEYPSCAAPVEDQASCGSCWAFSAVGAFNDRRCRALNEKKRFSPQYVVSCDPNDMGCNGGWLNKVSKFLTTTGTVEWSCVDYFSGKEGQTGKCMSVCDDGTKITGNMLVKGKKANNYGGRGNSQNMMKAIVNEGPIQVAFTVYHDFMYYDGGIYQHVSGYTEGGHAVTAVGYGEENGVDYWIIRNSWGPQWGESIDGKTNRGNDRGYFRIVRGKNECGIENEGWGITF